MADSPFIGRVFAGFKIESMLGKGGMGVVMKAVREEDGAVAAVKLIQAGEARDPQFIARFEREANVLMSLDHPNILKVYDHGRDESGVYYIVLEFIDGPSAGDVIKDYGRIPPAQALGIIQATAKALKSAHLQSVIHRDIKPDNILLTKEGHVRLADFGLAKDTMDNKRLTLTGQIMGTPAFMSPEQGQGEKVDHRSDIYSLGVTLYYMLAGERPFSGSTPLEVVVKQIQDPPPPLRDKVPTLPPGLYALVDKMLEKSPAARHQDHQEVVDEISEIAQSAGWNLAVQDVDGYDVTIEDAAGLAGMVKQALEGERTVGTLPADKAGRAEKIDTDELVGDMGDSSVGRVIGGKYEVRSKLGEGGMGAVFLVRHKDLRQDFALKLLHAHIASNEAFRERFLREAKAATAFTHKHAIQIRDFGHDGDALYMTMDFSRGKSLKAVLEKDGSLPESRTARIAHQVLMALREAHAAGLIHRDLKPDNLMIELRDGQDFVRILDFGVAKIVGEAQEAAETQAPTLTRTGTVVGTVQYMSPEQAAGDADIDARSDLYSLAAILYECIAGRRHIEAANMQQMMFRLATQDPEPLSAHVKGISKKLERLVMKNLSRERGKRSAGADEFLAELEACAGLQSTIAVRRHGMPMAVPLAAGAVALAALVVALLLWQPWASNKPETPPPSGPTQEEVAARKRADYERLKGLGEEARAAGDIAAAKQRFLEARDQRDTEEIRGLLKECTFRLALAACEAARADKDYDEALTQILLAKDNAPSGREQINAERTERDIKDLITRSEEIFAEAKTLDEAGKFLLAMPRYAEYIRDFPKGERAEAVRARYGELEGLTANFEGLLVKTEPPGAEVFLGGKSIGKTPVMHGGLATGSLALRIELEGYGPVEKDLRYEGGRLTVEETLRKLVFGRVVVRAGRTQVVVRLDGLRQGPTPLTLEKVAPGTHSLEFVGPGDVAYGMTVEVKAEETATVDVSFDDLVAEEERAFAALPRGRTLDETRTLHRDFLARYPKGSAASKIRELMADLDRLEREYGTLEAEPTETRKRALASAFLDDHRGETYPRGWYLAESQMILDALAAKAETAAYRAILDASEFAARARRIREFLDAFPKGSRFEEVTRMRRDLENEETDFVAFTRAGGFGALLAAAKSYLQRHPEGLKAAEVRTALENAEKTENDAFQTLAAEKDISKMIALGRDYLRRFPGSEREPRVRDMVTKLEAETAAFEATARGAAECDAYLSRYPKGRFRLAVETRRDQFGWAAGEGFSSLEGKLPGSLKRGTRPGEYVNRWDGAVMVYVPAGYFPFGTDDGLADSDDRPQLVVYLSAYFLDKHEVTNRQYGAFLDWWRAAPQDERARFLHPGAPAGFDPAPAHSDDPELNQPDQPVVGVSWFAAWTYARWAGKSLPTEAQWEKAASCDPARRVKTRFPWGNDEPRESTAWFDGADGTTDVATLPEGRSPVGALHMAGNVAEWCLDAWDPDFLDRLLERYPRDRNLWAVNPVNEDDEETTRAVRGGSYDDDAGGLEATRRRGERKSSRKTGFRCALWQVAGE